MEEEWTIRLDPDFDRSFRRWHKRHPESCDQAVLRIQRYLEKWLNNPLLSPRFNHPGWIHHEGRGILAVDQGGPSNLAEMRLYFWPDQDGHELWLIRLGSKAHQYADVAYCHTWLEHHHRGHEDQE
jgi:hypothetical protein